MVAIAFENVTKHFGPVEALRGITLSVEQGSIHALLGSNGAGKTTSVRLLLGLLRVDGGRVRVFDLDPTVGGTEVRALTGAVLDHDGLYDRLTVGENLLLHLRLRRLDGPRADTLVERGLAELGFAAGPGVRVSTLSRGNRQKVALARALLHNPRLLLLDEPFVGLDPVAAAKLRELIRARVTAEGTTVLVTTHDLAHVERLCDDVSILHEGRVVKSGSLAEIRAGESLEEVFIRTVNADA
jgi:ABC-type multidrug transport system ATPase subunit